MPHPSRKVIVKCSICSKEKSIPLSQYNRSKSKTFFCTSSSLCKNKWKTKSVEVTCGFCEKKISVAPYRIKDSVSGKVFCSRKCTSEYNRIIFTTKINTNCSFCNEEIQINPSNKSKRHFCSSDCYFEWNKMNSPLRKEKVIKFCFACGKEMKFNQSDPYKDHCCSKECRHLYLRRRMSGATNPNWHGGMRESLYGSEFNERLRGYVRDRFNRKCAWCGVLEELLPTSLQVHHINYLKTDNNPDTNLIPLCHQDHSRTNGNRTYWTNAFTFLMTIKDKQERLLTNNL